MATHVSAEIESQPQCWRRAARLAPEVAHLLPRRGERVAVVGCGTSWFIAMAFAVLREFTCQGETDAFAGSEMPTCRRYDRIVAITRSGTTTEVLDLLRQVREQGGVRTTAITGVADAEVAQVADDVVDLGFADEESVVQTRFATSVLALLRAHLGDDVDAAADDAELALREPLDALLDVDQVTFLGRDWTVGLAQEAALKTREAAQFWAEAYPAMDYRHGPIAIAQPGRLVWVLGAEPAGLADDVAATGATLVTSELDPMAHLVVAQRLAVGLAQRRGLDPDHPRHLTRSVVLPGA